jgi:hypothetical protein
MEEAEVLNNEKTPFLGCHKLSIKEEMRLAENKFGYEETPIIVMNLSSAMKVVTEI